MVTAKVDTSRQRKDDGQRGKHAEQLAGAERIGQPQDPSATGRAGDAFASMHEGKVQHA